MGDQIEVLLDDDLRRESDVVDTVELGARAVMIGCTYLWGLAAAGKPVSKTSSIFCAPIPTRC